MINLFLGEFNNNQDPTALNKTHIIMIPKCKNPSTPKDFRPISLYNMVMKLVTKNIANILKALLLEVIDEEKNVFVKGRLIIDNVLIAMECFH